MDAVVQGAVKASRRRYAEMAWHAWHIAAYSRAKRLPNLERTLDRISGKVRQEQTPEQMKALALMYAKAFGGVVTTNKDK